MSNKKYTQEEMEARERKAFNAGRDRIGGWWNNQITNYQYNSYEHYKAVAPPFDHHAHSQQVYTEPRKEEKEWEIVEWHFPVFVFCYKGITDEELINGGGVIKSVRRLSDGEVFTVGETIIVKPSADFKKTITGFGIDDGDLFVYLDWFNNKKQRNELHTISKEREPLFTTEDGKPVYDGDKYWFVWRCGGGRYFDMAANTAMAGRGDGRNKDDKYFSTEDAAKEWVLNNKPQLSLEDITKALHGKWGTANAVGGVVGALKDYMKSKINNQ